jgi:hypothetical protein
VTVTNTDLGEGGTLPAFVERVAAGTSGVRIVVERGHALRGRVLGPDGTALRDVEVQCATEVKGGASRGRARVAPDGSFVAKSLDASPHWVVAYAQGLAYAVIRGVVPGGDPVELKLFAGLAVEGVLVDDAGAPVGRTVLRFRPVGAAPPAAGPPAMRVA